jgi:GDP-4-dehydro-6-deoxy-D-mannose reductase
MNRALITGVDGFTGRHLARFLVAQGIDVFGVTRSEPSSALRELGAGLHIRRADLLDRVSIVAIVDEVRPSYIFQLASDRRPAELTELIRRNVGATYNVLEAALRLPRRLGVKVLVVGSAAEYGVPAPHAALNERQPLYPVSAYGLMKVAEVNLAHAYFVMHGLATVTARPFNLVGPGEPKSLVCSALASQMAAIESGNQPAVIRVGELSPERDFVDVRDAARAYWTIALQGAPGETYNVCSGRGHTIEGVLNALGAQTAVPYRVDSRRGSPQLVVRCVGDPSRIAREIGWTPTIPFERSLADLLDDWRRSYREQSTPAVMLGRPAGALSLEVAAS